jgi:membrane fusion protein (multidrug efflux system)
MTSAVLERDTLVRPKATLQLRPKRLSLAALIIAAIAGSSWYGYHWWTVGRFFESTDDAYVGGDVTAISPHVAGFISEVLVTDNQYVQAGQPLIRLDNRDFQAAADHAAAVLGQRKAALDSLRARESLQQSTIQQAVSDLDAKVAQADFAKEEEERYRTLVLSSAGTARDAQRAASQLREARAAVTAARAGVEAARQQLNVLDAQVAEAVAAVKQAEADLETARLNLAYTEIRSPIDGYVGNRAAQVGAYVAAGGYLLTVVPTHGLWIDANFKEDQLGRMQPGQAVLVVGDVMPDHVFRGRILSLAPGTGAIFSVIPPENATGNFTKIVQRVPVRIMLEGDDAMLGRIRPGLSVVASVDTRSQEEDGK